MSFDKTKAMRNAERFLSQGNIGSAIGEFRQVISHDPRDFGTMNMLGDLYVKNSETRPAVDCYKAVAEHYSKQGFAQKAIAVYNKVSKLQPNTPETILRLAELYREKGSIQDARSHFEQVADQYQKVGRRIEALEIWKQIADLDPTNPNAFLTIGEGYIAENCPAEAAESFADAGRRFAKLGDNENAFRSLMRSLDFGEATATLLSKLIETGFESGNGAAANGKVIEAHEALPFDREIHSLLVDCNIKFGDLQAAELSLVKLIEQEPASYPKLLDLGRLYLESADSNAAGRVLSMASEHMLIAGQAAELSVLVSSVLQLDPEHLDALRMMVRCASWLKDEAGMRASLTSMAKAAKAKGSFDDERLALSQLVMIVPHDTEFADRLKLVNETLGVEDEAISENLFDTRFVAKKPSSDTNGKHQLEHSNGHATISDFAFANGDLELPTAEFDNEYESEKIEELSNVPIGADVVGGLATIDEAVGKEIESIKFYIESGYAEIAQKAIEEFRSEYGDRSELNELVGLLKGVEAAESVNDFVDEPITAEVTSKIVEQPVAAVEIGAVSGGFDLHDLRSELGLDEALAEDDVDSDYETHYHTAVAYQEMYLLEDAIKEYQQAVSLIEPNDGTRRFFQCANLLGHCFMQLGKPNLAVRWFLRTLESKDTTDEERLGIWYELASAYEADGDYPNASKYYEQVYAENINFRDVASRVNSLVAAV